MVMFDLPFFIVVFYNCALPWLAKIFWSKANQKLLQCYGENIWDLKVKFKSEWNWNIVTAEIKLVWSFSSHLEMIWAIEYSIEFLDLLDSNVMNCIN